MKTKSGSESIICNIEEDTDPPFYFSLEKEREEAIMQKDIEKSKAEGKLDEERNTIIRLNESNASLDFNSSLDESAVKKLREEYSR